MNKYRDFLDGMASVFFLDGFFEERFVPKHSELFNEVVERNKNYIKRIKETTFDERLCEDIRADFNASAQLMNLALKIYEEQRQQQSINKAN
jgi:hypothetical protein